MKEDIERVIGMGGNIEQKKDYKQIGNIIYIHL